MDKQSAARLLNQTFNSEFNEEQFAKFATELFNKFEITKKTWTVWKEYQNYINSYYQIGSYQHNKKTIDILAVNLKKTSSRDRARTMQRNFIAKYLSNADKDAALVAFYGEDPQDWRFSFVKMEYQLQEVEPGKVKPVKELTPAKRYSFLVGTNEPNYTCRKQFLKLVMEEETSPSIEEIEQAFGIENVTKEFFQEYKELYLMVKESIEKIIQKNDYVKKEFLDKNISTEDFAKKLLGQIVFIYFLQKKGWLGVTKDEKGRFKEWGTGPKNFLRKLYDKQIVDYKNFFNDVLEPLFYEALATERDDDYYSRFNCKIPFLNGGLFEPINDYDWAGTEIFLDNSIFDKILSTFDRFNFTVKEDEPLEKEVAIDPEMLGKVFENLLEVKDRKSKGSFYTPREIVHYMCQQSLINYLETNAGLPRKDIEKFVQLGDFALDMIIKEQEQLKKYGKTYDINEKYALPKTIKENHEKINQLLKDIKIVDPAVGSGAFPVGMMNEIVKARSILSLISGEEKSVYDLKRETIENCLYGVDIDSSAVDIAKLRFWLSLIVDELDMQNIKPLPNLDHKIMCGNSLLEEFEGIKLFDERMLGETKKDNKAEEQQIKAKKNALYQELGQINLGKKKDGGRSKEIKKEIKALDKRLRKLKEEPEEELQQQTLNDILNKRIKESQKKLSELRKLQKEFFSEQNRKRKKEQAEQINKLEWELIEETLKEQGNEEAIKKLEQYKKNKSKPFFLWKLYFSEIFQRENPGFDVVIANPPYLEARSPEFTNDMKEQLQTAVKTDYPLDYNLIQRGSDLLIYFYVKGIQLVRKQGFISFITQNSWLDTNYGKQFQEFLLKNTKIKAIIDSDYKHFETANINTVLTFLVGNTPVSDKQDKVFFIRYHKNFGSIAYAFSKIEDGRYLKTDLTANSFTIEELCNLGHKWGFLLYADDELIKILAILRKKGAKIEDISEAKVTCGQGLNLTKDFLVELKTNKGIVPKIALIPIMTNKEGAPYELTETKFYLVDKRKLNKKQSNKIREKNIKTFNPKNTNKIPPALILPRGISRHYCSFNSSGAYSSSAVDIYIENTKNEEYNRIAKRLWLFLNSSIAWLIREISGRKNLGGGMLKAEATDLKQFELYFEFKNSDCEKIFAALRKRQAIKTIDEIEKKDHIKLDDIIFDYFNLSKEQRSYVISKLKEILKNREEKATSG